MVRTTVIRVNKSLYAGIPVGEARRLRIREGQEVDLDVRPLGATGVELAALKNKYKGRFADIADRELWGE